VDVVVVVVKTRRRGWAEHAARMAGNGNAYRYLEQKVIKMRPLSMRRNRWKNNIKVEINGIGQERGPIVDFYRSEQKKN
jgi:hypothetical protein